MSKQKLKLPTILRESPGIDHTLEYYDYRVCCSNCYQHDYVFILKGIRASGLLVECVKCGCAIKL